LTDTGPGLHVPSYQIYTFDDNSIFIEESAFHSACFTFFFAGDYQHIVPRPDSH
jgi:hypothetical protein